MTFVLCLGYCEDIRLCTWYFPQQDAASPAPTGYELELMKLGTKDSYLCLIPPPPEYQSTPPQEEEPTELTALHSWSLLQPLAGSCIYVCHSSTSFKMFSMNAVFSSIDKAGLPTHTVTTHMSGNSTRRGIHVQIWLVRFPAFW